MTQILPIYELANGQTPFFIRPLLRQVNRQTQNEPPHRHNYQELVWVKSGQGRQQIDQERIDLTPLTFYLITQGQIHHFEEGVDLEGFVIRFTDDFLLAEGGSSWDHRVTLFNHFSVHRSLTIDASERQAYEGLIRRMVEEQEREGFGRFSILRHLLSILLIQLERTRRQSNQTARNLSPQAEQYQLFLMLLEQYFSTQHDVQFYAVRLHCTPRQLSALVRRFTGQSAKQLIQARLLLEAKRLLQHSNASIKEIAYQLGYRDPSYFGKVFKRHVGLSPQEFQPVS